jgi:hypothetical protein
LTGAQGAAGTNGVGLVSGAYLYLPATKPAPTGFTKIGTASSAYRGVDLRAHVLSYVIYQKN